MNGILQYFTICILFNIFTTCLFFSLNHTQFFNNHIFNALQYLSFVNMTKILIQFEITRRIRKRLYFVKLLYIDIILDFAKIGYYTYMTIDFDKFFINNKMYAVFVIIMINYLVIFLQLSANMINPNIFNNTPPPQQLFIAGHTGHAGQAETYISFNNYLNVYTVSDSNNITCPICLDEKKNGEQWTKLHCEHEFHYYCIKAWTSNNRTCPTCRSTI